MVENKNVNPDGTGEEGAKLFTQEEVNRIVSERLTREKEKHDGEIAKLKLDHAVESALTAAKAKNIKAVRGLLDADKLKLEKDGTVTGLSDQIAALQKSDAYLFEEKQQTLRLKGFQPGASADIRPDATLDGDLRAAMRLP